MRVNAWRIGGGRTLEIKDWIVVGYGADDDEIEALVLVELDHSPADSSVGVSETSFEVIAVRYAEKSGLVEERFITSAMRAAWEERATGLVAEYEEDVKDAATEAKLDVRRDGD